MPCRACGWLSLGVVVGVSDSCRGRLLAESRLAGFYHHIGRVMRKIRPDLFPAVKNRRGYALRTSGLTQDGISPPVRAVMMFSAAIMPMARTVAALALEM